PPLEVGHEGEQRADRDERREQLARQREGLEERGRADGGHEQAADNGGYPPRQPTGEEHRAENRQGSHARRDRSHDFRRPPAEMKDPPEDQYQALWAVNPDVS